jgi:outer membrane protein
LQDRSLAQSQRGLASLEGARMKPRTAATLVLAAAALAGTAAHAQAKFAYCDMRRAMNEVEESKLAQARLRKTFEEKQKKLNDRRDELSREGMQLENQAREGMLKDEKLREKQTELQQKALELNKYLNESQKELQDEDGRITHEILGKMQGVIRGIAESEGLTFVFDGQVLAYAPDSLDITNEVVRKYNAKFGKGAAAAAPGDPAKKDAPKDVAKNSAAPKDAPKDAPKEAPKK